MNCFECGLEDEIHMHHVVPKSLGGTKTVPLCSSCHAKVHSSHLLKTAKLTKAALDEKRLKNERISRHSPYGYKFSGDLIIEDEQEQYNLTRMLELWDSSPDTARKKRYLEVSRKLAEENIYGRDGNPFLRATLYNIINRYRK